MSGFPSLAANGEGRLLAQSPADAPPPGIGPGNDARAAPAGDLVAGALDELIAAHQPTHGDFADTAAVAQALKSVLARRALRS